MCELVASGEDLNARAPFMETLTENGPASISMTPLDIAGGFGSVRSVNLLLKHGTKPSEISDTLLPDSEEMTSARQKIDALIAETQKHREAIENTFEKSRKRQSNSQSTETENSIKPFQEYVKAGYKLNRPFSDGLDLNGSLLLERVGMHGMPEVTKYLIQNGADPTLEGSFVGGLASNLKRAIRAEEEGGVASTPAHQNLKDTAAVVIEASKKHNVVRIFQKLEVNNPEDAARRLQLTEPEQYNRLADPQYSKDMSAPQNNEILAQKYTSFPTTLDEEITQFFKNKKSLNVDASAKAIQEYPKDLKKLLSLLGEKNKTKSVTGKLKTLADLYKATNQEESAAHISERVKEVKSEAAAKQKQEEEAKQKKELATQERKKREAEAQTLKEEQKNQRIAEAKANDLAASEAAKKAKLDKLAEQKVKDAEDAEALEATNKAAEAAEEELKKQQAEQKLKDAQEAKAISPPIIPTEVKTTKGTETSQRGGKKMRGAGRAKNIQAHAQQPVSENTTEFNSQSNQASRGRGNNTARGGRRGRADGSLGRGKGVMGGRGKEAPNMVENPQESLQTEPVPSSESLALEAALKAKTIRSNTPSLQNNPVQFSPSSVLETPLEALTLDPRSTSPFQAALSQTSETNTPKAMTSTSNTTPQQPDIKNLPQNQRFRRGINSLLA